VAQNPQPPRVLARILDLGRVSNDQGVHMSITLNSQIHGSSYARQQQCLWLFYALQCTVTLEY
jgi:hypothetical protein